MRKSEEPVHQTLKKAPRGREGFCTIDNKFEFDFFHVLSIVHARPHAAKANRWLAAIPGVKIINRPRHYSDWEATFPHKIPQATNIVR